MMTEDVVFLAAHSQPMVGKAAVRPWVERYLQAYITSWDKQSHEFVVAVGLGLPSGSGRQVAGGAGCFSTDQPLPKK